MAIIPLKLCFVFDIMKFRNWLIFYGENVQICIFHLRKVWIE